MGGFANDPAAIKAAQIEKAGELPAAQARETGNVFAIHAGIKGLQTQFANLLGALHTARLTIEQSNQLSAVETIVANLGTHIGTVVSELPHRADAVFLSPRGPARDFDERSRSGHISVDAPDGTYSVAGAASAKK